MARPDRGSTTGPLAARTRALVSSTSPSLRRSWAGTMAARAPPAASHWRAPNLRRRAGRGPCPVRATGHPSRDEARHASGPHHRRSNPFPHALGGLPSACGADVRQHHDELVASKPPDRVIGARPVSQILADRRKDPVSLQVAQRIVDPLEAIEVEEAAREPVVLPLGPLDLDLQACRAAPRGLGSR